MSWLVWLSAPSQLLALYVVALVAGLLAVPRQGRRPLWTGLLVIVVSLGLAVLAGSVFTGYAFLLMMLVGMVLRPLLAIGIGLALGGGLGWLGRGRGWMWMAVPAAVLIAVPGIAVDRLNDAVAEKLRARAERHAAFRASTITGSVGGVPVSFPAAPYLETVHRASARRHAYTRFLRDTALEPSEGPPRFLRVRLGSLFPECAGPEPPERCGYGRMTPDDVARWCATRQELAGSPWCERPRHQLTLWPARDSHFLDRARRSSWPVADLPPVGIDAAGAPIRLRCGEMRDPPPCRAIFALTEAVADRITLHDVEQDEVLAETAAMIAYAERLWSAMAVER